MNPHEHPKPPKESTVITIMIVLALIGFGALAEIIASELPPWRHERAVQLARLGLGIFGTSGILGVIFWWKFWRKK